MPELSPEQWRRAFDLIEQASERDPDHCAAFLDEACGDDQSLRLAVEKLLEADRRAGQFIESPAAEIVADLVAKNQVKRQADEMKGRRIGAYRIIREIGRGGMGVVYLAMRADDTYRKQVAIKLVKRGMDTDFILRRFYHERQILASLDHPNIARLLDGGSTEDGLPYFVMEYIEGQPLDEYCDRNQLNVEARLKLFLEICSAVSYAHRHRVIHRDLKPGNILVTEDGAPKLLDFGVAKLLQPDVSQTNPTVAGIRPMTLAYASPEQARGGKITEPSDVYSLGGLLYEMLAGRRPYRLTTDSLEELTRAICEQEPERLRRQLPGDLDHIVLMALRKEPERRYNSVEDFAADIRSFLAGRPVRARKRTIAYRAGKFLKRQHIPTMASALLLLAGMSVGFANGWFWKSARPEVLTQGAVSASGLARDESQQIIPRGTQDREAYRLYLEGRERWNKRTSEEIKIAQGLLSRAIERDPNFALAYAGLADCYVVEANNLPRVEALQIGKSWALKALGLDRNLAEAHTSLGFAIWRLEFSWAGAELEFKRAIELTPDYITAHQWYGLLLMMQGRFDEAEEQLLEARRLDPLSMNITQDLAVFYVCKRDHNSAIELMQEALEREPKSRWFRRALATELARAGRADEAIAAAHKTTELGHPGKFPLWEVYTLLGWKKEADELQAEFDNLEKGQLLRRDVRRYALFNRRDEAIAELERLLAERRYEVFMLKVDPAFDNLRDDPRYFDLLRRVGLEK